MGAGTTCSPVQSTRLFLCNLSSRFPRDRCLQVRLGAPPLGIVALSSAHAEAARKGGWLTKVKELGRRPVADRAWEGVESEKQKEMRAVGTRETTITDQC